MKKYQILPSGKLINLISSDVAIISNVYENTNFSFNIIYITGLNLTMNYPDKDSAETDRNMCIRLLLNT